MSMSMYKNEINVAIAGLGFGLSVHLPAIDSNKAIKPVAFWHPNKEKLDVACKNYNLKGFSDWNCLIGDKEIDAIIIATPPKPRFNLAKEALLAGKHLLLEKPVGLNAEEVSELNRIAITNHLSVAIDFEYRAVPIFMKAKRMLEQGAIGEPWLIKLDWIMSSRADVSRPWNWYSNQEEGGGVIGALGTHAFDMLHWLFGPISNVSALMSTSISHRTDPSTNKVKLVTSEDVALAQLQIRKQPKDIPVQLSLSAVSLQGRGCWIEIYGSEGTLLIGSDNQKDYVHGFSLFYGIKGQPLKNISPDPDQAFPTTWTDGRIAPVARIQEWWLESIKTGKPMVPGLLEGLASQVVCDRLKESASSGQRLSTQNL